MKNKNIKKLSEIAFPDPKIEYIRKTIQIVATKLGINNITVSDIDKHSGTNSGSGIVIEETYTAHIIGMPPKKGMMFLQAWEKQLASQKPNMVGHVGFIFEN